MSCKTRYYPLNSPFRVVVFGGAFWLFIGYFGKTAVISETTPVITAKTPVISGTTGVISVFTPIRRRGEIDTCSIFPQSRHVATGGGGFLKGGRRTPKPHTRGSIRARLFSERVAFPDF